MSNGHGGKRAGAGRPKKADELKLIQKLDNIINSEDAIKKLGQLVTKGDLNAIKIYMEYRFGKPKQTVNMDVDLPKPFRKHFTDFQEEE